MVVITQHGIDNHSVIVCENILNKLDVAFCSVYHIQSPPQLDSNKYKKTKQNKRDLHMLWSARSWLSLPFIVEDFYHQPHNVFDSYVW